MREFTLDALRAVMRSSAGVEDGVDLDGPIADVPFADLGYDSLAVLEIASQVGRHFGFDVPDDALAEMPTPAAAVAFVNRRLSAAVVVI